MGGATITGGQITSTGRVIGTASGGSSLALRPPPVSSQRAAESDLLPRPPRCPCAERTDGIRMRRMQMQPSSFLMADASGILEIFSPLERNGGRCHRKRPTIETVHEAPTPPLVFPHPITNHPHHPRAQVHIKTPQLLLCGTTAGREFAPPTTARFNRGLDF